MEWNNGVIAEGLASYVCKLRELQEITQKFKIAGLRRNDPSPAGIGARFGSTSSF